jgi:putative hemolysin
MLSFDVLRNITVVSITLILSFMTLVFGELVPKRIALAYSYKISMFALTPLKVIATLFKPFVFLLTKTTEVVVSLLNIKESDDDDSINERQIRAMIERSAKKGKILSNEKILINNIFEFDDKRVTDIMTHRTELVAFDKNSSLEEVMKVLEKERLSRIPVYDESPDQIVGVLYARDVMSYLYHNDKDQFQLTNVLRKPYFVVESKRIDVLLKELQQQQIHMAIIVDEFGGVEGIVTLEDIIEELVGEIFDEDDILQDNIKKISEDTWRIDGSASIFDVNRILKVNLPFGDYDTVGGLLFEQLGYIPKRNEKPVVKLSDVVFTVEKMKAKKIELILAKKINKVDE